MAGRKVERGGPWAGAGLALGAMISAQLGAAAAVPIMIGHGSFGVTALRLGFGAIVLLLMVRPRLTRRNAAQWGGAMALGLAMAATNLAYYAAVLRIPLGAASTIEFLGPLALSAMALRGWPRLVLPLLAGFGILAMTRGATDWLLDPVGVALALGSGTGWAIYIVLTRRVGRLFDDHDGTCLAVAVAALIAVPVSFVLVPQDFSLDVVPAAAGLGLLSPSITFSCEMLALRRMNLGAFGIFMSLEPALGALLAYMFLHQTLSPQQVAGLLMVTAASLGAVGLSAGPARVAAA